jgi:phosphotransferase system  glucose/maltose/N-acetylglucosamine-specific IIC component
LFIGGICGWFLSFCSLLVTDIILGESLTIRWSILFMMSGVMLIGWCYFPLFIFLMKHFNSIKRKP